MSLLWPSHHVVRGRSCQINRWPRQGKLRQQDGASHVAIGSGSGKSASPIAMGRGLRALLEAPATAGSLDTLTEVGLWDEWVKAGAKPSTPEELSKLVPMDAVLLSAWSSGMHFLSTMRSLRTNN